MPGGGARGTRESPRGRDDHKIPLGRCAAARIADFSMISLIRVWASSRTTTTSWRTQIKRPGRGGRARGAFCCPCAPRRVTRVPCACGVLRGVAWRLCLPHSFKKCLREPDGKAQAKIKNLPGDAQTILRVSVRPSVKSQSRHKSHGVSQAQPQAFQRSGSPTRSASALKGERGRLESQSVTRVT